MELAELRRKLARLSLDGLSIGDAFGNMLTWQPELLHRRVTPVAPWQFTDDTIMGICVTRSLATNGTIDQDDLARRFAQEYALEPQRGYGAAAQEILRDICNGRSWRAASAAVFHGSGSMGNGGAMRVGPIGGFFYDAPDRAAEQALLSAEVTHSHQEGKAGAIAVAVAASFAADCGQSGGDSSDNRSLISKVLPFVPSSMTKDVLQQAAMIPVDKSEDEAAKNLGCGERVLSQDTVPFCIWSAQKYLEDFSKALWATASVWGDVDTNCAIVGSIVSLAVGEHGIPRDWRLSREPLNG